MPIAWDKYSAVLRKLHQRPRISHGVKRIALVGLPLLDRGPHPMKMALADCLERHEDWQVVFMSDAFLDTFRLLRKLPCDGILARVVSPQVARLARSLQTPLVNVSSMVENPGVHTVRREDRAIGRMCADHLLERGFQRIGVLEIVPTPGWCFSESMAGFHDALRESGRKVEISRHRIDLSLPENETMKRFGRWLRSLERPSAIFTTDDRFILSVIETCNAAGFRIPRDIALISAAGTPEMMNGSPITITHPVMDAAWLLDTACKRLEELMSSPRQPVRTITIPVPGLVLGESTDTLAIHDPLVAQAVDFVAAHFQEGINVPDVVDHLRCSRRSLERRFHQELNSTVHLHIINLRLKNAKAHLEAFPEDKVEVVARKCGFSEIQAFRHAFILETGVTPSDWRNRCHKAERLGT